VLAWLGAIGLVTLAFLSDEFSFRGLWQPGVGVALVVAVAACFVFVGRIWATRGAFGGIAAALGAAMFWVLRLVPGTPLSLPRSFENLASIAVVAISTTVVFSTAMLMLYRKRRLLNAL
jgi:hypothetical protein